MRDEVPECRGSVTFFYVYLYTYMGLYVVMYVNVLNVCICMHVYPLSFFYDMISSMIWSIFCKLLTEFSHRELRFIVTVHNTSYKGLFLMFIECFCLKETRMKYIYIILIQFKLFIIKILPKLLLFFF